MMVRVASELRSLCSCVQRLRAGRDFSPGLKRQCSLLAVVAADQSRVASRPFPTLRGPFILAPIPEGKIFAHPKKPKLASLSRYDRGGSLADTGLRVEEEI